MLLCGLGTRNKSVVDVYPGSKFIFILFYKGGREIVSQHNTKRVAAALQAFSYLKSMSTVNLHQRSYH